MSGPINTYRVYCFDGSTMALTGDIIEAASDAHAIARAESRGFGSKCEIWHGDRLVARLEGERRLA